MGNFSYRNDFVKIEYINDCPIHIRTQLLEVFLEECGLIAPMSDFKAQDKILCAALYKIGIIPDTRDLHAARKQNIDKLSLYLSRDCQWYQVYDFVEFYLQRFNDKNVATKVDTILKEEHSGYRIVNNMVVPITNEMEINEIGMTQEYAPAHVWKSINNALIAYSKRPSPDYNSATANMVAALEAMARTILKEERNEEVNSLTLAINKLVEYRVIPHDDFVNAIKSLYKYASDEGGVRHGKPYYTALLAEDARFCIISCSAMINFLIAKYKYYQENPQLIPQLIPTQEDAE